MKKINRRKGFTIVELVIVIAVIAILAAVLIPTFGSIVDKAKDSKAIQEAKNAYTQHMIDNAADAEMARYYVFKADKKRFVAILDGAPQGVYETRTKAVKSFSDHFTDDEGNPIPYNVVDTLNTKLWAVVENASGVSKPKPELSAIDLEYGNKYQNDNDRKYASSSVNLYMRAGEAVILQEGKAGYKFALVRTPETNMTGTLSNWFPSDASTNATITESGWYGFVLLKNEGEFDFDGGNSKKLSDYVWVEIPMQRDLPLLDSIRNDLASTKINVFLYEGETITVNDGYQLYIHEASDIVTPQYNLSVFRHSYTADNDGWFTIIIKNVNGEFPTTEMNLYDYVTISGAEG